MKLWIVLLFGLFLGLNVAISQTTAPKYSNDFLKIGVGAAAAGMGNAQTAFVKDATAGYWNPAALMQANRAPQVALMHSEYFAGIAKYDYGAFATRIQGNRHFAASFIRIGIDDIPNTLNLREGNSFNYDRITSFSVADMALIVSYAQQLGSIEGLSVGGNAKIINRITGKFATAWGFGIDLGVHYQKDKLKIGFVINDVTTTFNAWSFNTETFEEAFRITGNEIPQNSIELTLPSSKMGVAYSFFPEKKFNLSAAFDTDWYFDGKRSSLISLGSVTIDPKLGIETTYKNLVFLRAGAMNFQQVPDIEGKKQLDFFPTLGAGLRFKGVQIDYALANIGDFKQNLFSHLLSLQFVIDKSLY